MTSLLVTETSKKDYLSLEQMSYIYYFLPFQKDIANINALIDSSSEVNAITPTYTS